MLPARMMSCATSAICQPLALTSLWLARVPLQNLVMKFFSLKFLQFCWSFFALHVPAKQGRKLRGKLRGKLREKLRPELPPSKTETSPKTSLCRNPLLSLWWQVAPRSRRHRSQQCACRSASDDVWAPHRTAPGSAAKCFWASVCCAWMTLPPSQRARILKKAISLERLKISSFRLKFSNLAWKVQSRLKFSILTLRIPHKNRGLVGGSLEILISLENVIRFNLAWKFQSRAQILIFLRIWALWVSQGKQTRFFLNRAFAWVTPAIFIIFVVFGGLSCQALVFSGLNAIRDISRFRQNGPFFGGGGQGKDTVYQKHGLCHPDLGSTPRFRDRRRHPKELVRQRFCRTFGWTLWRDLFQNPLFYWVVPSNSSENLHGPNWGLFFVQKFVRSRALGARFLQPFPNP